MRKILVAGLALASLAVGSAWAQAPAPLRIGVIGGFTGVFSDLIGGEVEAAQMAVDEMGGKVLGRPIEILSADHQNKPDIGVAIARKWYDVDGVSMITGIDTSSVALAVRKIAQERSKIDIHTVAGTVDLTGPACSATGAHWVYDTYALARVVGSALAKAGDDTWFLLTADYAFGHAIERDLTAVVTANGGKIVGTVKHPLSTQDFSSFLLQAQASKAKIIALANGGADSVNSIKQANEFAIGKGGQKLVTLVNFATDVQAMTLPLAQGLILTEAFYWDLNDETRAWTAKFRKRKDKLPNMVIAGAYSATLHYLKAVQAAGTDDAKAVMAKMRELPVNDMMTRNGKLREDGRLVRDMHVFQVKTPAESRSKDDLYKLITTVPGDQAYRPMKDGNCPLVKN
ncbi:ABC transporter substrate-binding protein [Vineibacter terrae]|uniref:ABC transporter substrate-binding protein n=1 Tax=Vineibacter terrae TaxID=2586908 RepID=UPI002E2F27E5|nr:ABC transporter substrate-binding protein [Vineibacter terrae]HEX2886128.1 ABC transporter substrate-binding protein [Vineibacter terrae]